MLTVCHNPVAFQNIVTAHCTDPGSKTCTVVIAKAAEAYGSGCLDLPARATVRGNAVIVRRY